MPDIRFLQVDIHSLKIRDIPAGKFTGNHLGYSTIIEVDYEKRVEQDGFIWIQHSQGWTAIRPIKLSEGQRAYVRDITHEVPASGVKFKVTWGSLNIRKTPNGDYNEYMLLRDDMMIGEIIPDGQPTDGGHIWWKQPMGWVSEKQGSVTYMERLGNVSNPRADLTAPPEPLINPTSTSTTTTVISKEPETKTKTPTRLGRPAVERPRYYYLVTDPDGMSIRKAASARAEKTGLYARTDMIFTSYDEEPQPDSDNKYLWVKHVSGDFFVALGPVNGSQVWMQRIDDRGDYAPAILSTHDIDTLPSWRSLFTGLPVDLPQKILKVEPAWFQYFGNNVFAFTDGSNYNYDGYSQGLHGGLDFGSSTTSMNVYARLDGKVIKIIDNNGAMNQIHVESGPYLVIYQHLEDNPPVQLNQVVAPDTLIGKTKFGIQRDALDHLHLEVRYRSKMIVNPLELFPDEYIQQIMDRFNPEAKSSKVTSELLYFMKTSTWNQWADPFGQPVIWNRGPVIGPKAR